MRQTNLLIRVQDTARAMRCTRALVGHDAWTPAQLAAHQRERLAELVSFAGAHSRYYGERFAAMGVDARTPLEALPILDKATMMARFDDIVTDPRLRRDELLAHAAAIEGDPLHAGEYRVTASSGSSRLKGLHVFDRDEWATSLTTLLRCFEMAHIKPRLPRRLRMATVVAPGGRHMTARMTRTIDMGAHRMLRRAVTEPVDELVPALNAFQPEVLGGYPSVVALLAAEQLEGRLRIAPRVITTSSEPCTPQMRARITEAWGVQPFDIYATTESGGPLAHECERHSGLHLFEDQCLIEVVDEQNRPVPDGELGAKILVTPLWRRSQPIIRLEVTDMLRIDPGGCACGRPHRVARAVEGRTDDVLHLPSASGATVPVHPLHFAPLTMLEGLREFEVVYERDGLHVRLVVAPNGAGDAVAGRAREAVRDSLERLGVADPAPRISLCDRIERDPATAGKVKLVRATPR